MYDKTEWEKFKTGGYGVTTPALGWINQARQDELYAERMREYERAIEARHKEKQETAKPKSTVGGNPMVYGVGYAVDGVEYAEVKNGSLNEARNPDWVIG